MKSYLSLAWKELRAQKVTSILILIAVVLSTVATTALGQSVGILQAMRLRQAASLNGDRYATFHQLTPEQKDALSCDSRLDWTGSLINLGNVSLGNSGLTLYLREYQGNALDAYPSVGSIKEGHLPAAAGEIALSGDALQYLDFRGGLGDTITLPVNVSLKVDNRPPYEYTAHFVLTGILENNYTGYTSGILDAVVGEGTAAAVLPERYFLYSTDFKTKSRAQFQEIVDDLAGQLQVDESDIQYNWVLLDALGISHQEKSDTDSGKGFPFMMAACVLVGVLVLLAAGLVIYNVLKVSVTKRIREYGTLRAIGGEGGQLYALVTAQLLLLCGIGLPPGLLLGSLCAKGILTAALGFLNPDLFLAETAQELKTMIAQTGAEGPLPLAVSVLVTLVFAGLASFPSARYASRVSPTVALGGQPVPVRRRSRRQRRIRNFESYYARLNLKRNRGRTAITILSIVMSITVFVALQSFSSLLDASRSVQDTHIGDYAVTNEAVGLSPEAVSRLAEQEQVESLATTKLTVYTMDETGALPIDLDLSLHSWETFQIAALNDARLSHYVSGLSGEEAEALQDGRACLVKNPIPFSYEGQTVEFTELRKNDVITVNGKQLRVVGIAGHPVSVNNGSFSNGVQLIVSDSLYKTLVGDDKYSEIYPTLKEGADAESFEHWLDGWCREQPGSHWLSYRQFDDQLAESFEQIRLLCWGLILFIGLIGILNIINTVYTNIHTRIREIGMQRAIGMSARSLYKTFLWEGAFYGLIASLAGAVCGYLCTIMIRAAATDALQLVAVPVMPILESAAVSVAACLLATALPLRAIGNMSIVDSIETAE